MGMSFDTWNEIAGPIYMGANSSSEVIWTLISVICCVAALVVGSMHELDAYKREKSRTDK